ncbi:MAG: trigger factor [Bacteroidales bacterium]|nr:trigger factor [Bacteroidales bacterium]
MEISRENTGELTATVKIAVSPAEYNENVNKVLKDYQRKANVPGFRPGHVPFGLVKKMYGSAVFADEVNKLVSDALNNYITEEKLDILGQPLPNMDLTPTFDWNEEQEISFFFDLAFSPSFELAIDESVVVDYHKITVNDELLDKYMTDLRQRYGTMGSAEAASEKDVVEGDFVELDSDGNPKEGGIHNRSKIMIDTIKDEEAKKLFLGCKIGDDIVFNPAKTSGNASETASMLGIAREAAEGLESDFRLTVTDISTMMPAEMNEEFFSKVFPDAGITTEEDFRLKLRAESENSFVADSDHLFMHHVQDKIMEMTPISLPDAFMKRWLVESNEGKLTEEVVEKDYDKYAGSMKWQLIENRIIKEFGVEVGDAEIKEYIKDRYLPGWRTMPLTDDITERLDTLATNFLETRHDEVRRILDAIYEVKIAALVKSKVKLNEIAISYDEFVKLDAERH